MRHAAFHCVKPLIPAVKIDVSLRATPVVHRHRLSTGASQSVLADQHLLLLSSLFNFIYQYPPDFPQCTTPSPRQTENPFLPPTHKVPDEHNAIPLQ